MRVLIADDSKPVRERLVSTLSELDDVNIVGQAENTIEAKILIKELNPDLLVLDIRMPGGTGMNIIDDIKKFNPKIIIIILTNYHFSEYKQKCMKEGADYFFSKSDEYEKVIDLIDKLKSKKRKPKA
ncbi:response regulator transcription factor [Bacteroidota bacterium]